MNNFLTFFNFLTFYYQQLIFNENPATVTLRHFSTRIVDIGLKNIGFKNTYDETFGQQQTSKRRQDASKMSSELKSTKVDDWLKTHTPLRTGMTVNTAQMGDGFSF